MGWDIRCDYLGNTVGEGEDGKRGERCGEEW